MAISAFQNFVWGLVLSNVEMGTFNRIDDLVSDGRMADVFTAANATHNAFGAD